MKIVFYTDENEAEVIETSNASLVEKIKHLLRTGDSRCASDIIDRSDYIATKLWCEEDVLSKLAENGYEASDENLEEVLSRLDEDILTDCTDQEWKAIDDAICASEEFLVEAERPDTSVYFQDRDFLL